MQDASGEGRLSKDDTRKVLRKVWPDLTEDLLGTCPPPNPPTHLPTHPRSQASQSPRDLPIHFTHLTTPPPPQTPKTTDETFTAADMDKDGKLSADEWMNLAWRHQDMWPQGFRSALFD